MTLGNYWVLPLADARLEAEQQKKLVREGKDPLVVNDVSPLDIKEVILIVLDSN